MVMYRFWTALCKDIVRRQTEFWNGKSGVALRGIYITQDIYIASPYTELKT
jgi:hypothetical protein